MRKCPPFNSSPFVCVRMTWLDALNIRTQVGLSVALFLHTQC